MLALIPLNLVLARIMRRLSHSLMKRKDDRVCLFIYLHRRDRFRMIGTSGK